MVREKARVDAIFDLVRVRIRVRVRVRVRVRSAFLETSPVAGFEPGSVVRVRVRVENRVWLRRTSFFQGSDPVRCRPRARMFF